MKIRCYDIVWDTTSEDEEQDPTQEELGLPSEVILDVEEDFDPITESADRLSDLHGWCIHTLQVEVISGTYVSVWDSGEQRESPCTVNHETRTVEIHKVHDDVEELGTLEREYVKLDDGEYSRYEACPAHLRKGYIEDEQAEMFFWE